jgi:hypothetical protein
VAQAAAGSPVDYQPFAGIVRDLGRGHPQVRPALQMAGAAVPGASPPVPILCCCVRNRWTWPEPSFLESWQRSSRAASPCSSCTMHQPCMLASRWASPLSKWPQATGLARRMAP